MRNIENFSLTIAIDMFRKKGQEVKALFEVETQRLVEEYSRMHSLVTFYEKKFKSLLQFTGQ